MKAFNKAWKYRFPTFILGDGYQAKMRESLTLYDPVDRHIEIIAPEPFVGKPGTPGVDRPPAQYRNTYSMEEELAEVLGKNIAEYEAVADEISEYEEGGTEGADLVIVAHGLVSRAAKLAVRDLAAEGIKVGYFRPITLRPLPVRKIRELAGRAKTFLVVESSYGQMARVIMEAAFGATVKIVPLYKPGEGITAEEVITRVKELVG